MKKLLAILLTLALMLPLCGLAEENAPQATLTTITFRDFNGRALMAEMEEAAETAYRDLLDALRVEVYRQGFTSCELFLNDQSIVDYGVQTRGADVYISGDVLGGTAYRGNPASVECVPEHICGCRDGAVCQGGQRIHCARV